ncbi:aminotransferase [Kickxella alabastrina]|uniref:aminotransferase n=1 Tax=Kickxella alabastrina TaxID=61397 RepID=UPI00221E723D|nr:aminotransferase [Kickxella alabastrina]KAI7821646.1 aminotransferase [Kickxella alabastrina]
MEIMEGEMLPDTTGFQVLETTIHTEQGAILLLDEHLERMRRSSETLSKKYNHRCFALTASKAEIQQKVQSLVKGSPSTTHRVRLLLSNTGGLEIQVTPEPAPATTAAATLPLLVLDSQPTDTDSVFIACKTTHRDIYNQAVRRLAPELQQRGAQVLLYNKSGEITETNIANIAVSVMVGGEMVLVTPRLSSGLLAGTMRAKMLNEGRVIEGVVTVEQFHEAAQNGWPVLCMNSVRGEFSVKVAV